MTVEAQTPQTGTSTAAAVTVEGCLVREAQVPGREPNIAEKAGIAEDYILTATKMIKGTAPAKRAAKTGTADRPAGMADTPTGTAGKGMFPMYEVVGLDDEKLKPHLGQRVQIEGTFENLDEAAPGGARTESRVEDLVELRGTTIRQVAGDCPAKPVK
jgi:hypothetical protein